MSRSRIARQLAAALLMIVMGLNLCACGKKDYSGTYEGQHNIFQLTLDLKSDGKYVFEQYEPFTGGITERGVYEVKGDTIFYYDSRGKSLKYEGKITGDFVTVGSLKLYK